MSMTLQYQPATRAQLEADINYQEKIYCALTALAVVGGATQGTHDDTTEVPPHSLELVLDPDGTAAGSAGSALICRGSAILTDGGANAETKVAAFRKAAA